MSSRSMSTVTARPIEIPQRRSTASMSTTSLRSPALAPSARSHRHRGRPGAFGRPSPRCPDPGTSATPPMCTCIHPATCCMCVCVFEVSVRNRYEDAGVMVDLHVVTIVGGRHRDQILFCGFSTVGSPWHLGVRWMRRTALCLGSRRSRERLNVLLGHDPTGSTWPPSTTGSTL
jgi:hypothetical protein